MPEVKEFTLEGVNSNAFSIMGYVRQAMIKVGLKKEVVEYLQKAQSSDYDNLVAVSMDYIEKCNELLTNKK